MWTPDDSMQSDVPGTIQLTGNEDNIGQQRKKNKFGSFLNGMTGQDGGPGGLLGGFSGMAGGGAGGYGSSSKLGTLARFFL